MQDGHSQERWQEKEWNPKQTTLDFIYSQGNGNCKYNNNDSRFVMYSQSGDHLQKDLAKFSYRPDMRK